jgi:amidophosphoribosyltransferase
MSDPIHHHCGVALIRLLRPLAYYEQKYGTPLYGFNQLFLLMEKQHNRGQDGAGIGCVKLDMPPGKSFMFRERDTRSNALTYIFSKQLKEYNDLLRKGLVHPEFPSTVKEHFEFGGEVLLGHLRYGTSGSYDKTACHPYFRKSSWATRNVMLCGNFNLTNTEELNQHLISRGAHPIFDTDTQTVLEEIGFHLDEEHTRLYRDLRDQNIPGADIPALISEQLDPVAILRASAKNWDGGYTLAGLIGNGDAFVMRDPHGIRPGFFLQTDEIVAVASERVALQTIFDAEYDAVREVLPGHALVVKADGRIRHEPFTEPAHRRAGCSFERIYFSRGNDADIYRERKALGARLADPILDAINNDLQHTIISYIPNTAESAYYGLMEELRRRRREQVKAAILSAQKSGRLDDALLDQLIMANWPRGEKIALKDHKLRTFISQEHSRLQMASHVYDITYGVVTPEDNLICIDDSIVRGTTLKQSILRILARTRPKKILIASTAPQIRYPDCYGIDMSELGKFIAFQAAVALCKERGLGELLREIYQDCVRQIDLPAGSLHNHVRRIYEPFSAEQLSAKIAELARPTLDFWTGEVQIIFQKIEDLHRAIPGNPGDWYFTGHYPTPGGLAVLNRSYINYYENKSGRSY